VLREPHAVLAHVERVAGVVHRAGTDAEDHELAAPAAGDGLGRGLVGREVDVRSRAAQQAFAADRLDEARHRAVKEDVGGRADGQIEIDRDRVTLIRPDARAVGGEGEALLVALADEVLEIAFAEREAARREAGEDLGDRGPAAGVEVQAEGGRLVPEAEGEELRDPDRSIAFHRGHDILTAMQTATASEVIAAIDQAWAREPGGAIAFDGDGTLWSGDIGEDFFDAMLKRGPHDVARDALLREAVLGGVAATGSTREIAHAIHAAYLASMFPEERICEIVAWIAAGWTVAELDRFCAEAVVAWDLRARLHGEAMRVLEHARGAGIEVFLVSASPRGIVEAAARVVGVELANVSAVRERVSPAGVVECGVHRPIPYGEGKVSNLRAKLGPTRKLYAAFGDNAFDVALLRSADIPVAIRPKMRLLERRSEVPGLVVLEQA